MKPKYIINFFNFFGILNVNLVNGLLTSSNLVATLNFFKVIVVLASYNASYNFMAGFFADGITDGNFSSFFVFFVEIVYKIPVFAFFIIMIRQLHVSKDLAKMINNMATIRDEIIEKFQPTQNIFDEFEKIAFRGVSMIVGVTSLYYISDYFSTYKISFASASIYLFFNVSYFSLVVYASFVFAVIQFFVFAEKALSVWILKLQNSTVIMKNEEIEDIMMIRSSLFSIKQMFVETSSLQIFIVIFCNITQTVAQVKQSRILDMISSIIRTISYIC